MTLCLQAHGAGRPLVVLPSFSLDHDAMAATLEPVFTAGSPWRRIYVDLPGTGGSSPGEPRSDAVMDAVLAAIEAEIAPRIETSPACTARLPSPSG